MPFFVTGFLEYGTIHQDLVDAFKPVMMLMPRSPTNPQYREFLQKTLEYSVSKFNLTQSPAGAGLVSGNTEMNGVLATILYCKAILGRGQSWLMMKFGMNHAPGAGSIA